MLSFIRRNFTTLLQFGELSINKFKMPYINEKILNQHPFINDKFDNIDRLEITIYNPNTDFRKNKFRTHKYECRIIMNNNNYIILQKDNIRSLIHDIKLQIKGCNIE
jgi:hypothetical protein